MRTVWAALRSTRPQYTDPLTLRCVYPESRLTEGAVGRAHGNLLLTCPSRAMHRLCPLCPFRSSSLN
jgi:hypothetical protein